MVASGERLYQLHGSGAIWQYMGTPMSGWLLLDYNPATKDIVAGPPSHAPLPPGERLYQLHHSGAIWRYTGTPMTGWQLLDNNPDTAAIVGSDTQLYQLRNIGEILRYTGTPMTGWQLLDNNLDTTAIAAAGAHLYQLHGSGAIWRYTGTPMTGWQLLDNKPNTTAIVAAGEDLYQLRNTGEIWRYTGTPMTGWQLLDNNPNTFAVAAGPMPAWASPAFARGVDFSGIPVHDWTKVAGARVELWHEEAVLRSDPLGFVIMRATLGTTVVAPNFPKNWSEAHKVDIVRGAYHWFWPTSNPADQARHYAKTVGSLVAGDLPPILDLEVWETDKEAKQGGRPKPTEWLKSAENRKLYIERAKIWIDRVMAELDQTEVIIYTGPDFWINKLGNPSLPEFLSCYLWVSHYKRDEPPLLPDGWTDWYMWQYKGSPDTKDPDQKIPGIPVGFFCDLNVFTGSLPDLRASVGLI